MKRNPILAVALLSLTTLLVAVVAGAQDNPQLTPQQKRQIAVTLMRMINNAQVAHFHTTGRFAELADFTPSELDSTRARASVPAFPDIDLFAGADAVSGFKLRITVSVDGRNYSVKLNDKDRGNCGTDAFTDDVGVIYFAGPIDCNFTALQPYTSTQPVPVSGQSVALASGSPTMVRISQAVADGNIVNRVDPEYPVLARQARIQGSVVLQILIHTDGSVSDVRVISGHPMLVQAAIDAVRQWRYKPYLLNGAPVAASAQIAVPFTLQ